MQCCGGNIVTGSAECCGDEVVGKNYSRSEFFECCGTGYIPSATATCCVSRTGEAVSYAYRTPGEKLTEARSCCGSELLPAGMNCCGETMYDPELETCADSGASSSVACGLGTLCPLSAGSAANCGVCDFNAATSSCFTHEMDMMTNPYMCPQPITPAGTVGSTVRMVTVDAVRPDSHYQFYLEVATAAGATQSAASQRVRTLEAAPEAVFPPNVVAIDQASVNISWQAPGIPNGIIVQYRVYVVDGDTLVPTLLQTAQAPGYVTVTTSGGPYSEVHAVVEVCTAIGCNASAIGSGHTLPGGPDTVAVDTVVALTGGTALNVSWNPVATTRGIITQYRVNLNGSTFSASLTAHHRVVQPLVPFTWYNVSLTACTGGGCTTSAAVLVRTLGSAPTGPLVEPRVFVLGASRIEVTWSVPVVPNGDITGYELWRNTTLVYNGTATQFVDTAVVPSTVYTYAYVAQNAYGETQSQVTVTNTPEDAPALFDAPLCTSLSSTSILVSWTPPRQPNGQIIGYRIVAGSSTAETALGLTLTTIQRSLEPFTAYTYRVIACTAVGCSASATGCTNTTLEASPIGIAQPNATVVNASAIALTWTRPVTPNGIITRYDVEDRVAAPTARTIYSGSALTTVHTGLLPYTVHQYRVIAYNSVGAVESGYTVTRTAQGAPADVQSVRLTTLSVAAVGAVWDAPLTLNGIITQYEILDTLSNSTVLYRGVVAAANLTVTPFTTYAFVVRAFTAGGFNDSASVSYNTAESVPVGVQAVAVVSITPITVRLQWAPPTQLNGVLTRYELSMVPSSGGPATELYRGTQTTFVAQRLSPFTSYIFALRACTSVGCADGPNRTVVTSESAPQGVGAPIATVLSATVILVRWSPPRVPNGVIVRYNVYRVSVGDDVETEVYAGPDQIATDSGLLPYTRYSYYITATNGGGTTASPANETVIVQTSEAAPRGMQAPVVSHAGSTSMHVQWLVPTSPNGNITQYRLFGRQVAPTGTPTLSPFTYFTGFANAFTVTGLQAEVAYEFAVEAFNSVGSVQGAYASNTTCPLPPRGQSLPIVSVVNATALDVTWSPPDVDRGATITYQLLHDGAVVYQGALLAFTLGGLLPDTNYTLVVLACRASPCADEYACAASSPVATTTAQSAPQGMRQPVVQALTSREIEVMWTAPYRANGVITAYNLYRNETLIYTGLALTFDDLSVAAQTTYAYTVVVRTTAGRAVSPAATATTPAAGAPDALLAPTANVLSSSVVQLCWSPATGVGAATVSYRVVTGEGEQSLAIQTTPTRLCTFVEDLEAYSQHDFRIAACVSDTVCSFSPIVHVRTECAPSSAVTPIASATGVDVDLQWLPPSEANCNETRYRVEYTREAPGAATAIVAIDVPGTARNFSVQGGCVVRDVLAIITDCAVWCVFGSHCI